MKSASITYPKLSSFINKVWSEEISLDDIHHEIPEMILIRTEDLVTDLSLDSKGYLPHVNTLEFEKIRQHKNFNDFRYTISEIDQEVEWERKTK